MKILHITECYGGGVGKAIDSFTEIAPEGAEHFLLYTGEDSPSRNKKFESLIKMPSNPLMRVLSVKKAVKLLKPNMIIAHSSWAGVYSRVIEFDIPIFYEPHCYAFEDLQKPKAFQSFFYFAEKILAKNTKGTIVLSLREKHIAEKLNKKQEIINFPNVNSLGMTYENQKEIIANREKIDGNITISMCGRLAGQKDPIWFSEVVKEIKKHQNPENSSVKFLWIGDGEEKYRTLLTQQGIEVTGWKDKKDVKKCLEETSVYLHSALYEGFPISVLDTIALGVPIVARDIACFEGTPIELAKSPAEAARKILDILESEETRKHIIEKQSHLLEDMNEMTQKKAIEEIFSLV